MTDFNNGFDEKIDYVASVYETLVPLLSEEQIQYLYDLLQEGGPNGLLYSLDGYKRLYNHCKDLFSLDLKKIEKTKANCSKTRFAEIVLFSIWLTHVAFSTSHLHFGQSVKDLVGMLALDYACSPLRLKSNNLLYLWPFGGTLNPFFARITANYLQYCNANTPLTENLEDRYYFVNKYQVLCPKFLPKPSEGLGVITSSKHNDKDLEE